MQPRNADRHRRDGVVIFPPTLGNALARRGRRASKAAAAERRKHTILIAQFIPAAAFDGIDGVRPSAFLQVASSASGADAVYVLCVPRNWLIVHSRVGDRRAQLLRR
jgi:hypothetical protein